MSDNNNNNNNTALYTALYTARSEYPGKWLQRCLIVTWPVPHETAAVLAQVQCTPYRHAHSLQYHFIRSHIRRLHVCSAVTGYLHFWQNGRYLLRATAVTRGLNEYRHKNQSARKADYGEEISPAASAGTRTRDLSIMSASFYH